MDSPDHRAPGRLRRPPLPVLIDYTRLHKEEFGVEPICRVLTEHGTKIAPSTYYDNVSRQPSRRTLWDAQIVELIESERGWQKLFARSPQRDLDSCSLSGCEDC